MTVSFLLRGSFSHKQVVRNSVFTIPRGTAVLLLCALFRSVAFIYGEWALQREVGELLLPVRIAVRCACDFSVYC